MIMKLKKKRIPLAGRMIGCFNGIFWSQEIGKRRKYNIRMHLLKAFLYGKRIMASNEK